MIDAGRLRRALHLDVVVHPDRGWLVGTHRVVRKEGGVGCDCPDSAARPAFVCKHRLAVVLFRLPPEIRQALRELVPVPRTSPARTAGRGP